MENLFKKHPIPRGEIDKLDKFQGIALFGGEESGLETLQSVADSKANYSLLLVLTPSWEADQFEN